MTYLNIKELVSTFSFADLADVLLMSIVIYIVVSRLGGKKTQKVAGTAILLVSLYVLTDYFGMSIANDALTGIVKFLPILLIVVFQKELRFFFEAGLNWTAGLKQLKSDADALSNIVRAAFDLARDRIGALIIVVGNDDPDDFLSGGRAVIAQPEPDLLKSIFFPNAPAHDGAVIIVDDKITAMGCVLPLSERSDLPDQYGTRHRAAIGLSEKCDAVALVVSEERGEISTVYKGDIKVWNNPEDLEDWFRQKSQYGYQARGMRLSWLKRFMFSNYRLKAAALFSAFVVWLFLTPYYQVESFVDAYPGFINIPDNIIVSRTNPGSVSIPVNGDRLTISRLGPGAVGVDVDLTGLDVGTYSFRLAREDFDLPEGVNVDPEWTANIMVFLEKKM